MNKTFLNLTEAQQKALSLIAINEHPFGSTPKTLQILVDKGLIIKGKRTIYGKGNTIIDRIPMIVDDYTMPMNVHYQWCKWCSENYPEEA